MRVKCARARTEHTHAYIRTVSCLARVIAGALSIINKKKEEKKADNENENDEQKLKEKLKGRDRALEK